MGLKQIILIDEEPGDVMGHADGMLFFIKPKTLFVGDFEGVDHVKNRLSRLIQALTLLIYLPLTQKKVSLTVTSPLPKACTQIC
ncbi:Uncharacterised protein [Weissella viridescens]|uniref:Uncharacterized protein n=1 Tax=Weissella viridescens TaxID=1629 RepID=A0A380P7J5_WEIVI|nr:Uncharacterised protein [Weissella viridescens]